MTYMIRPAYDPVKAGSLGITKAHLMESVKSIEEGAVIGIYRDEEKKVPVLLKSETSGINDPRSLGDFSVWNGEKSRALVASNPTGNLRMGISADQDLQPAIVYGSDVRREKRLHHV